MIGGYSEGSRAARAVPAGAGQGAIREGFALADPHSHFNWAANAMNFALIGAAWVVADWLAKRALKA